ncbi:MAG: hypothetical protein ACK5OC_18690 [Pirellula sp.]|jgi:hypothetical protein
MPRLNVTFRCSLPFDDNAHPIGEEIAEYFAAKFKDMGIHISRVDNYDDFAWSLDTTKNGKKLFLLLGYVGDGDFEWLMQINEYSSFFNLFRRKSLRSEREAIAYAVHAVLNADNHVSKVRWHVGEFSDENYTHEP